MRLALPVLLLLSGCATQRIDRLAAAGWTGEACHAALSRRTPEVTDGLAAAHLVGAPKLTIALPDAAPFVDAPGHGESWAMLAVVGEGDAVGAPTQELIVDVPGWKGCAPTECDDAWLQRKLSGQPAARRRGPGLLGGLFKALTVAILLPVAVIVDVAVAPVAVLQPRRFRERSLTGRLGRYLAGDAEPTLPTVLRACPAGAACGGLVPALPDSSTAEAANVQIAWRWRHDDCAVTAAWEVPLAEGPTLGARLDATFGDGIELSDVPVAAWQVDAIR